MLRERQPRRPTGASRLPRAAWKMFLLIPSLWRWRLSSSTASASSIRALAAALHSALRLPAMWRRLLEDRPVFLHSFAWLVALSIRTCGPADIDSEFGTLEITSAASDAAASDSCEPPCCAAAALGRALTNIQTRYTCWVSEEARSQRQAARAQRSAFFYSMEFAPGTFYSLAICRSGSWCEGCSRPPRDARHALVSVAHLRGFQREAATSYR